nr:protein B4 isoform X2 [Geotrypetes seraphini]
MVIEALKRHNDEKGVSVQAIQAYILANYDSVDPKRLTSMLRTAFAKGLETGVLVRPAKSSAVGVTGRFKLVTKKAKVVKATPNVNPSEEQPKSKATVGHTERKATDEDHSKWDGELVLKSCHVEQPARDKTVKKDPASKKAKPPSQDMPKAAGKKTKEPVKKSFKESAEAPHKRTKKTTKGQRTQAEKLGTSEKPAPASTNGRRKVNIAEGKTTTK